MKLTNLAHLSRSFLNVRKLWNSDASKILDLNRYGVQSAEELLREAPLFTWL